MRLDASTRTLSLLRSRSAMAGLQFELSASSGASYNPHLPSQSSCLIFDTFKFHSTGMPNPASFKRLYRKRTGGPPSCLWSGFVRRFASDTALAFHGINLPQAVRGRDLPPAKISTARFPGIGNSFHPAIVLPAN